jgi:hypothetical protein
VFVIRGELEVNGQTLKSGDQARISGEKSIRFVGPAVGANVAKSTQNGGENADFLFIDLP